MPELTPAQHAIITAPPDARLFLRGPAGAGKTTVAIERMKFLLENGVPAGQILVLTPQRTLQDPYLSVLHSPTMLPGGEATSATVGGLARRTLDLFWPLVGAAAGFAHPEQPPIFLTLETAQYYMARVVRPHLEQGFFESVTMDRNRLYSQILDNLNKSATIGFPHTEIGERLSTAWAGDPAQRRVYADAQACADEFRAYCLDHNLLDFSLQLEIFARLVWNDATVRSYLQAMYRHLIYDNVEEDVPVAHDILAEWLPAFDSALLVFDDGGGYRRFLGADPQSALALAQLCDETVQLPESLVVSPGLARLSNSLAMVISPDDETLLTSHIAQDEPVEPTTADPLALLPTRFFPEMLDGVAAEVRRLVDAGTPASQIVVLAPYLSDALRFSLMSRLGALGVPARSHRPSRSLREEPASQCLLTLAALAHPGWGIRPEKYDVAYALLQSIADLDLVRAQLLTEIVYRQRDLALSGFERIHPGMQERITYVLGERYTRLRDWLQSYTQEEPQPLDHFLRRLFGEVLSQPGFGFHSSFDAPTVAANLIESIQKFRLAMEPVETDLAALGREYVAMLKDGVIAAQFVPAWNDTPDEAVLLAPAYTFLMSNRPVEVQFWLDAGSDGWVERLFQPLTHPYVLSRTWSRQGIWTDADEVAANSSTLAHLLTGLLRRCRSRVYLCLTELGESGYEQRGALLRAFNRVLTQDAEQ